MQTLPTYLIVVLQSILKLIHLNKLSMFLKVLSLCNNRLYHRDFQYTKIVYKKKLRERVGCMKALSKKSKPSSLKVVHLFTSEHYTKQLI